MADHDDAQDYTANGPTDVAFRTGGDGTGIRQGVVAIGTQIGVSGTSLGLAGSNFNVGVAGKGDHFGVHGLTTTGIGVFGRSDFSSGVEGASAGNQGQGVRGVGHVGVVGDGDVTGVNGLCRHAGTGVLGECDSGIGVEGKSDSGSGVIGRSTSGVGASFTSSLNDAVVGRGGGLGNGVRGIAGDGAGVRGDANKGIGVFGVSESAAGVVGNSRSASQPGVFGFGKLTGVAGRSAAAPGVFGESTNQAGVVGTSTRSSGVFGFGTAAFTPVGPPAGVFGVNDKSVGVLGSSLDVIGVWGNTNKGLGVVGTTNSGAGVPTDRITDEGIGAIGLTDSGVGVAGMSASGTGVFGSSATGLAGHFRGAVTIEGDLTIIGGTKSTAVPHPDGSHRQLYCMESPESWFEDFGEARLVAGTVNVPLDPGFAALVEVDGYHVFLTAYGESRGMFVEERSASAFRVREHNGGVSDGAFAYRVAAKRKGIVAKRLPKVSPPHVFTERPVADLRLTLSPPDIERLSVTPLDPPYETGDR